MLVEEKNSCVFGKAFRNFQEFRLSSMKKKLALEIETQANFVGQVKKLHEQEVKKLDDLIQQQTELNNGQ